MPATIMDSSPAQSLLSMPLEIHLEILGWLITKDLYPNPTGKEMEFDQVQDNKTSTGKIAPFSALRLTCKCFNTIITQNLHHITLSVLRKTPYGPFLFGAVAPRRVRKRGSFINRCEEKQSPLHVHFFKKSCLLPSYDDFSLKAHKTSARTLYNALKLMESLNRHTEGVEEEVAEVLKLYRKICFVNKLDPAMAATSIAGLSKQQSPSLPKARYKGNREMFKTKIDLEGHIYLALVGYRFVEADIFQRSYNSRRAEYHDFIRQSTFFGQHFLYIRTLLENIVICRNSKIQRRKDPELLLDMAMRGVSEVIALLKGLSDGGDGFEAAEKDIQEEEARLERGQMGDQLISRRVRMVKTSQGLWMKQNGILY